MKISPAEFEKLALEQTDMLYRVARRLTRDPDRASDLVQETFLRAWRGREGFELHEHGIRPWLVRIMQNLHMSRSERESHQPRAIDGEALEAVGSHFASEPLSSDLLQDMDQELVRALQDLPDEYQIVLMLWAVEDFAYKEIAAALNVPIGTVMSRLHRARQQLHKSLRSFGLERRVIRE